MCEYYEKTNNHKKFLTRQQVICIVDAFVDYGLDRLIQFENTLLSKCNINNIIYYENYSILMVLFNLIADKDILTPLFKILVTKYFADINILNDFGVNVLFNAVSCRLIDIAIFLIDLGIDTSIVHPFDGTTFLDHIENEDRLIILKYYLHHKNIKPAIKYL